MYGLVKNFIKYVSNIVDFKFVHIHKLINYYGLIFKL